MADWYRLGQLGSRAMPEFYAAQARELEAQKQRMGVEQLGEQMARSRELQQRQDITWEQQQADRQAEMQRAEQERSVKQQKLGAMDAFWRRDPEKMKQVLDLDGFEFGEGMVKIVGKNGQSYDVPEEEFVASMGEPSDLIRAKQLGIQRQRAQVDAEKAAAVLERSKQQIEESKSRVQKNRAALSGGGSKDKVGTPNQRFLMKSLMDRGMSEPEARSNVASFGVKQRRLETRMQKLEAERAKVEADPDLFGAAKAEALARISNDYRMAVDEYDELVAPFEGSIQPKVASTPAQSGGFKLPPPPPGTVISKPKK